MPQQQMEQTISVQQFKGVEPIANNEKEEKRLAQLKEEIGKKFISNFFWIRGQITEDMGIEWLNKLDEEPSPEMERVMDKLEWVINVSANQNEMSETIKGELFAKYIGILRARFGFRVSTEILKSLCSKSIDNASLHITYLMRLAGLITLPTYNYPLRRVFDLVYSPKEEPDLVAKGERQEKLREEWVSYWLHNSSPEDVAKIKEYEEKRVLVEVGPEEL